MTEKQEQFHFEVTKEFKDKYKMLMIRTDSQSQKELFINVFEKEFTKNRIDDYMELK